MTISQTGARPISAAEGRARRRPALPVWQGPEYHRYAPGVYDVRCNHVQGPEWLKNHRRWSLRLECNFLTEEGSVSGFLNLGNHPKGPHVGRRSLYFQLWSMTNHGLPRRGQVMAPEDFIGKFYRVRIDDSAIDAKGREIAEDQRYSKIVEFLEYIGP